MIIYLVGGAVRDQLLGLPVKEKDWVVVGATVEQMLQQHYRQVGKEFPVFLHPQTHEEYALARKERKVAPGYKGFTFEANENVTLEDDLLRRDLTINAMAQSLEGELIDPYHGKEDLERKILRHVSPAFAEDPVRILRVARFAARYAQRGFIVAPETIQLMQNMVKAGEVDALVAERVWKEFERALSESSPNCFFKVLAECQALSILFPMIQLNSAGLKALEIASQLSQDTLVRYAALMHDRNLEDLAWISKRYRLPTEYRQVAQMLITHQHDLLHFDTLQAAAVLNLLSSMDALRREKRFLRVLEAMQAIAQLKQKPFSIQTVITLWHMVKQIDIQPLIKQGLPGALLAEKIKSLRLEKIAEFLKTR